MVYIVEIPYRQPRQTRIHTMRRYSEQGSFKKGQDFYFKPFLNKVLQPLNKEVLNK